MKNCKVIIILLCIVFLFCGCTSAPPSDCSDELISNNWLLYDGNNAKSGKLSFSDGYIILSADIDESNPFVLKEECIVDTEKIVITSENYGILNIKYTISGDNLTLSYSNKNIILKKENKP